MGVRTSRCGSGAGGGSHDAQEPLRELWIDWVATVLLLDSMVRRQLSKSPRGPDWRRGSGQREKDLVMDFTKFVFFLVLAWCAFMAFVIALRLLWGALQLGWFLGKVLLTRRTRRVERWRPARGGEGYAAAPYDGRPLPKVASGPATSESWR